MLVSKDEISRQIYDGAVAAAKASAAAVTAAAANVEATRQSIEQARSGLSSARASHRAAQTAPRQVASDSCAGALRRSHRQAETCSARAGSNFNLGYTKIIAPVSGLVNKTVVVGMNVQPGQQLLTVVPLQDVWITANFKETQLRNIRPGQQVRVLRGLQRPDVTAVGSTASRERRARSSACFRRRMPRAITSRSCRGSP